MNTFLQIVGVLAILVGLTLVHIGLALAGAGTLALLTGVLMELRQGR